jgi:hypothetical protein
MSKHALVKMKLIIGILAWITLSSLLNPKPTLACTCAAPVSPAAGLKRSVAVFRGRVIAIDRPLAERLGASVGGTFRVRFQIVKRWKGASTKTAELVTRLTGEACGFPFEMNKEYLVYAVAEPKDIQTGICAGTKGIDDAVQEMKQLDKILAGAGR